MDKKLIILLIAIILISTIGYFSFTGFFVRQDIQQDYTKETSVVARVIDGDTVELIDGERVRLIGIDTAEKGHECYKESTDRLRELVEGKDVILERDVENKDRYDRLLRFIFLGKENINVKLVREGLAKMYTIKPNVKYHEDIQQAFLAARTESGCLWSS
ncbi:MAG: thermonuclease family protein [Candidatus Aenigmarchaeota archaeon]|nr:thermonuclease family protein [Candidatus Aenigmarchaeota archaeon]